MTRLPDAPVARADRRRSVGPALGRVGYLLAMAAAVFLPLTVVRYPLVDARSYPLAIGLTVAGHIALAAVYWPRRARLVPPLRGGVPALLAGLVLLTASQVVVGRLFEAVAGRTTLTITLGGLIPSLLIGPAWALLVVAAGRAREDRARTTAAS